jgi:hypothetical protein
MTLCAAHDRIQVFMEERLRRLAESGMTGYAF